MTHLFFAQTGIGTYTVPQVATPLASSFSKLVDEAIAWHLDAHVMGMFHTAHVLKSEF